MVDCIVSVALGRVAFHQANTQSQFADVAQPDQARIVGLNAHLFLKVGGGVIVSIKANCIDSTAPAEQVFAREVQKLREERIKPKEQLTLEPFERDHAIVCGIYQRSA